MSNQAWLESLITRTTGRRTSQKVDSRADRKVQDQMSQILLMPELPLDATQDTDPSSATFGQFFFLLDYDPLP